MSSLEDPREFWDGVFRNPAVGRESGDEWLGRWTHILDDRRHLPVLELGCGSGGDTRFLTDRGLDVVATDFSTEALRSTRANAPASTTMELDIGRPLPFRDSRFGVVVASLSLHYFPLEQTRDIVSEVRRVLVPGGFLLARVNSKSDSFHDISGARRIERDFYVVGGIPRRLFDRESIEELFDGWQMISTVERKTGRFGREKTLWEIASRRSNAG